MGDSNCDEKRRITRRTVSKPKALLPDIEWTEDKYVAVLKVWREIAVPFHSTRSNSAYLDKAVYKLEEQNIILHPGELRSKLQNLMCRYKVEVEKLVKNNVKPQKLWKHLQPINEIYDILKQKGIKLPRCVEQIDENIVETVKAKILDYYGLENMNKNSETEVKEELLNENHTSVCAEQDLTVCAEQDLNNVNEEVEPENVRVNGVEHISSNGDLGNDLEDDIAATIIQRNIEPPQAILTQPDTLNLTTPLEEDKENPNLQEMELETPKLENSKLQTSTKRTYKSRKENSRIKKVTRTKTSKNTRSLTSKIEKNSNNATVQHKILDEIIRANSLAEKEIKESRKMNKKSISLEEKRMRLTEFFSERSLALQESLLNFMGSRYRNLQNGNI